MKIFKKIFTLLLILMAFNLYLPKMTVAEDSYFFAQAGITEHSPESLSTPEEDIPGDIVTHSKKKGKTWLWVLLGAVVIGGGAAAVLAGGGDDSGGDDSGTIDVSW